MPILILTEALLELCDFTRKRGKATAQLRNRKVESALEDMRKIGIGVVDADTDVTLKIDANGSYLIRKSNNKKMELSQKMMKIYVKRGLGSVKRRSRICYKA